MGLDSRVNVMHIGIVDHKSTYFELKYNELLKDDKNPVHYNKENKGVLKHLIENSKENVDLNAF